MLAKSPTTSPSVSVLGNDAKIQKMFYEGGFTIEMRPEEADILVFTGGTDVNPALYGEEPIQETGAPDIARDTRETMAFEKWKGDKFLVGICRGSQFLNVMNGGRLWQDINHHTRPHLMYTDDIPQGVPVTSTHHQMMIPNEKIAELLGWSFEATRYKKHNFAFSIKEGRLPVENPLDKTAKVYRDAEMVWYKSTRSFCFQPHPEYGLVPCRNVFFDYLTELYA